MVTFLLPNEIIIIIYTYAHIETKYKLITLYNWLLKIKVKIRCGSNTIHCKGDSTYCNNDAIYLLKFKIQSTHNIISHNHDNISKQHWIYKAVCSLKCKKTLILRYDTVTEFPINYTDTGDTTGDTSVICRNTILIKKDNNGTEMSETSLKYVTLNCHFYYGNGYGNEWYNTEYRVYYNNKYSNNSMINLEYYIYNIDTCILCSKDIFNHLVNIKGFLLTQELAQVH